MPRLQKPNPDKHTIINLEYIDKRLYAAYRKAFKRKEWTGEVLSNVVNIYMLEQLKEIKGVKEKDYADAIHLSGRKGN